MEQNETHNILGTYLDLLPRTSCATGTVLFFRLQHSVNVLPELAATIRQLRVLERAQRWEMCRSLMIIFHWYANAGPEMANRMMEIHQQDGYLELMKQAPFFAPLVDHIVQHAYNEQQEHKVPAKKKSRPSTRNPPTAKPPSFGPHRSILNQVPSNLYGLQPTKSDQKAITLPSLTNFKPGRAELYNRSSQCLQDLWSKHLILPQLKSIDDAVSSGGQLLRGDKHVLHRSLTRGAILQCIADACETDTIFASTAVDAYLVSPAVVFEKGLSRSDRFASAVLKCTVETLSPLFNWVEERVAQSPGIVDAARGIGEIVHYGMMELHEGRSLTKDNLVGQNKISHLRPSKTSKQVLHWSAVDYSAVRLDLLLPGKPYLGFGVMGLIVREALNERRHLRPANEMLRRILEGKHATLSTASSHNRDHTDPIRQYSHGAQLLYQHLPGSKITSSCGLSNLLSWLGTGQGNVTKAFLDSTKQTGGFFAEDSKGMVETFTKVINLRISNHYQVSVSRPESTVPGFIPTFDVRIWGQPSNHLKLTPTRQGNQDTGRQYSIQEKFEQYFTTDIQKHWCEWLGPMQGQDPNSYTGSRKTWRDYLSNITRLSIPGFKQGLTVFQLVNYLVFLGIARMPTCSDLADFIHSNRRLGAFHGLESLGFVMKNRASVHAAFMCVHQHLDRHLTQADKELLGFGPIFTEHLLCKVVRWTRHVKNDTHKSLEAMGTSIEEESWIWEAGLNISDHTAFPFPLQATPEELNKVIAEAGKIYHSNTQESSG